MKSSFQPNHQGGNMERFWAFSETGYKGSFRTVKHAVNTIKKQENFNTEEWQLYDSEKEKIVWDTICPF